MQKAKWLSEEAFQIAVKERETKSRVANICWIIKKAREFQKNIYFCFIDSAKAFDCVDHNKLWKILQVMGIPDHLTCLLRDLYAGQEATVKSGHGIRLVPNKKRSGCAGTGGPRGAIPHCMSGRAAVRRYLSSKVRSNGCVLLEQP